MYLCNNATMNGTCKSEEEIKKWLEPKYIVIYQNMQRFQSRIYSMDEKVISESKTVWFPINTVWRTEIANLVEMTYLDLQDNLMQFGDVTEDNRNITTIREFQSRSYGADNDIQVSIIYERDLDLHRVDREVYSILDWLGDVGGLYEAFHIICGIFIYVVNFLKFENFMVSELFKKELDDEEGSDDKKTLSRANT